MEICVGAAVSADKTLLGILEGKKTDPNNPNFDMHRVTAATIYNCTPTEVTPKQRQDTKAVNFGAFYGITFNGLREQLLDYGIDCTDDEARSKLEAFFDTYPGVKRWFKDCRVKLNTDSYITHPYGRIRRIQRGSDTNEILSATNFVIQGWCASIMKECVNEIDRQLLKDSESHVALCIHDEIIVETTYSKVSTVAKIMTEVMNIEIEDKAKTYLTAAPEIKFNLSKGAQSYTVEGFTEKVDQLSDII